GELVGILGLRELLITQPQTPIADIMDRAVDAVGPDMDQEVLANQFDRYGYSMMPVVDNRNYVLGVVTVDDVIDIIREEQTEDVQRTVGAGAEEGVHTGFRAKLKGRLPWLLINLLTSFVAGSVVLHYSLLISQLAVLAALMPIIANQAGNAGQQSLAVTLRGIVLDQLHAQRVGALIFRETLVGTVNGLIAGTVVGSFIVVFNLLVGGPEAHHAWALGLVTVISMAIALSAGCCAGCSIPLLMRRLGVDPAHGSTIFLTMITDTLSFLTFLTCSRILWEYLVP
ncbi:MAG TPA: magnesium transporter, partial [Phycisphaerales bacterium]|nr:magnesium transporter [Phycisphaerales bacterium]